MFYLAVFCFPLVSPALFVFGAPESGEERHRFFAFSAIEREREMRRGVALRPLLVLYMFMCHSSPEFSNFTHILKKYTLMGHGPIMGHANLLMFFLPIVAQNLQLDLMCTWRVRIGHQPRCRRHGRAHAKTKAKVRIDRVQRVVCVIGLQLLKHEQPGRKSKENAPKRTF